MGSSPVPVPPTTSTRPSVSDVAVGRSRSAPAGKLVVKLNVPFGHCPPASMVTPPVPPPPVPVPASDPAEAPVPPTPPSRRHWGGPLPSLNLLQLGPCFPP